MRNTSQVSVRVCSVLGSAAKACEVEENVKGVVLEGSAAGKSLTKGGVSITNSSTMFRKKQ